jgi:hypothetical protein
MEKFPFWTIGALLLDFILWLAIGYMVVSIVQHFG